MTSPAVIPSPVGLASQTWSAACGYIPSRPRPFTGAAATDATAVPCSSNWSAVVWAFRTVVPGRLANSSCAMSTPVSMTVNGLPGPGGTAWFARTTGIHHSSASSGSAKVESG